MVKRTGDIIGDKSPKPERTEVLIVLALIAIVFLYMLSRSGLLQLILRWAGVE